MIKNRRYPSLAVILLLCGTLLGCSGSTTTESAARTGALLGGMSDGWAGAATGAILGGVLGSAVDHADDRKAREDRKRREQDYRERMEHREADRRSRMQQSSITADSSTAYRPAKNNILVGSTWRVVQRYRRSPDFFRQSQRRVLHHQFKVQHPEWPDGHGYTRGESCT